MFYEDDDIVIPGDLKPISDSTAEPEFQRSFNAAVETIRGLAGNVERVRQTSERVAADLREQMKAVNAGAGMRYEPAGDAALLDARYCEGDGVRLGRSEAVDFVLPDGSVETMVQHGLLTDPYPATRAQQEAQEAYHAYALAMQRARRARLPNVYADPLVRKSFGELRRALVSIPGRAGAACRAMFADGASLQRAISNTSGVGAQLIASPQTGDIIRPYDLARRIAGMFPMRPAPAPVFKRPTITGRARLKARGVTGDDPTRYPVATWTTSEVTLTIVDLVIMALLDTLWVRDAATLIANPMGEVVNWLRTGVADSLEVGILHGDTAATHQDAVATWTLGGVYTAGDLAGSDEISHKFLGLRAKAFDDSTTNSGGGTFDFGDYLTTKALMGVHASAPNVKAITGLATMLRAIASATNFQTVDKFGTFATMITGTVGKLGGDDVVLSQFMNDDLANTGLYTGSGSTGAIVVVAPDQFAMYELAAGSEDFDAMYPERGGQYVGSVIRRLFTSTCLSTEKPVAYCYNI